MRKQKFNPYEAEEHFTNQLQFYVMTKNSIFEKDNENSESVNKIYSEDFHKWLGMEIALREVLDYMANYDF